jgi:uncharacterized protein YraI
MLDSLALSDVVRAGFAGGVGFVLANYVQKLVFSESLIVGGIVFVSALAAEYLYAFAGPSTAYSFLGGGSQE